MLSEADQQINSSIVKSGKLINIEITDHLIITSYSFYSFADNNLLYHIY
ncbi:JAB domain-containing protein [Pedobacter punctiformis]